MYDAPMWMDLQALAGNICCSERTVLNWVDQGILPAPKKRGGKLMWRWKDVDDWLENGPPSERVVSLADRIRQERAADVATRQGR